MDLVQRLEVETDDCTSGEAAPGDVRMTKAGFTPIERIFKKISIDENGCWNFTGYKNPMGYGQIHIGGKRGGAELVHRVVWKWMFGDISDGLFICHKCDNPACFNPNHLFKGDHTANMKDMRSKGRERHVCLCGERCVTHKLTWFSVREIRELKERGVSNRELGRMFGVSHGIIGGIVNNKSWIYQEGTHETRCR